MATKQTQALPSQGALQKRRLQDSPRDRLRRAKRDHFAGNDPAIFFGFRARSLSEQADMHDFIIAFEAVRAGSQTRQLAN